MNNNLEEKILETHYSPLGWWLHVGSRIYGDVLIYGDVDNHSIYHISELSNSTSLMSNTQYTDKNVLSDKIKLLSKEDDSDKKYDSIIISSRVELFNIDTLKVFFSNRLAENGVICIFENNPFTYQNLFKTPFDVISNSVFNKRRNKLGKALGFPTIERIPTISYDHVPYESFFEGQYSSNKNSFLLKEKVKKALLNSRFSKLFTNSFIWVIQGQDSEPNLVRFVLQELQSLEHFEFDKDMQCSVVYYKLGKIIFTFSSVHKNKSFIVVMALDEEAISQRTNEMHAIRALGQDNIMKEYVLDRYEHTKVLGFDCFVMRMYEGLTVDVATNEMEMMTKNAYSVLEKLSVATVKTAGANAFKGLIDKLCIEMTRRISRYSKEVSMVHDYLLANLNNDEMTSVCMHGDLKLENFMMNDAYEVTGVIDWELCELEGFKMIDLYYLINYNHQVIRDDDFCFSFVELCNNDLQPYELELLDNYSKSFSIDNKERLFLLVVYFVHHYGARYYVNQLDQESVGFFEHSLNKVLELISKNGAVS